LNANRIHHAKRVVARRMAIRQSQDFSTNVPHRLAKVGAFTNHHSRCVCCMNPRRRGELTMQERRLAHAERDGRAEYFDALGEVG